jgi:hypothetical protein
MPDDGRSFDVQESFVQMAQNHNGAGNALPVSVVARLRASPVYGVLSTPSISPVTS